MFVTKNIQVNVNDNLKIMEHVQRVIQLICALGNNFISRTNSFVTINLLYNVTS